MRHVLVHDYYQIDPDCRRVRDDLRISGYEIFESELQRLLEKLKEPKTFLGCSLNRTIRHKSMQNIPYIWYIPQLFLSL